MSTKKRSTKYWIQFQLRSKQWSDLYESHDHRKGRPGTLSDLEELRARNPLDEYRLVKKVTVVTTTVVNGAET